VLERLHFILGGCVRKDSRQRPHYNAESKRIVAERGSRCRGDRLCFEWCAFQGRSLLLLLLLLCWYCSAGGVERSQTVTTRRRRTVDDARLRVAVADVDVAARSAGNDLERHRSTIRECQQISDTLTREQLAYYFLLLQLDKKYHRVSARSWSRFRQCRTFLPLSPTAFIHQKPVVKRDWNNNNT